MTFSATSTPDVVVGRSFASRTHSGAGRSPDTRPVDAGAHENYGWQRPLTVDELERGVTEVGDHVERVRTVMARRRRADAERA